MFLPPSDTLNVFVSFVSYHCFYSEVKCRTSDDLCELSFMLEGFICFLFHPTKAGFFVQESSGCFSTVSLVIKLGITHNLWFAELHGTNIYSCD